MVLKKICGISLNDAIFHYMPCLLSLHTATAHTIYHYTFFQGLAPADVAIQQVYKTSHFSETKRDRVCKQTTFEVILQPGSVRFQQAKAYGTAIEVSTELLLICGRLLMAFDLTISAAPSLSTSDGNGWVGIFFSAMM